MLFSLIVATCDRRDALKDFFESIRLQQDARVEVLVADQNPPGFLESLYDEYRLYFPLIVLPVPVRNASAARNAGILKARGDVIAFPDDDCRYLPHAVARVASLLEKNTTLGGLLVSWADRPRARPHGDAIRPLDRRDAFHRAGTLVQFYRRDAIEDIRFDPELGPGSAYGSGEDTDFLLQALAHGVCVGKSREVLIVHPEPDFNDPNLVAKARSYALGRMKLLRKHNFSVWFKLANVLFPLARLPWEWRGGWKYRLAMFLGRLQGLLRRD